MFLNQEDRPAPAPDEREAPVVVATATLGGIYHGGSGPELGEIDIEVCMPALEALQCETVNSSDDVFLPLMSVAQHERIVAALTRPAQAEQQPFGWVTEDYLTDKSATTYDQVVADRWRAKGWPIRAIYAAPIAQTAPQRDGWISVEDRLPEARDGTRYLVARDCGNGTLKSISVGFLLGGEWHISDDVRSFRDMGYRVTHWQLLPAAPGE